MPTSRTFLIVPAITDQAGQCRIVTRLHETGQMQGLAEYRRSPDLWAEAGLMSSRGTLRCLDATPEQQADIRSCEPLRAPMTFTYAVGDAIGA